MKGLEYLVGGPIDSVRPLEPYSEIVCLFCQRLSQELLADRASRAYPDVTALAFWCRKSNILRLKETFGAQDVRLGRGLAFHIAPANIPVNFAFSFLFSLLAGNGNVVRLPSKPFAQTGIICGAIRRVLAEEPFEALRQSNAFVSYPSSETEITAELSAAADIRVIWGGDATIDTIRRLPAKPRCVDLCFADRYSVAVVDGCAVLEASDAQLARQAEGFYNDTYLMDQNACSSPQIIFWRGGSPEAKARFWNAIADQAQKRYPLQAASAVDKYTKLCEDAIDMTAIGGLRRMGNELTVLTLTRLPDDITGLRGKCGYFYEFELDDLSGLAPFIGEKVQTITSFGVEPEEVRQMVLAHRLTGVDRIVPFGSAMDIGVIWDGYDVVRSLSRVIALV